MGTSNLDSMSIEQEKTKSKSKLSIKLQFADNIIESAKTQYINVIVLDIDIKNNISNAIVKGNIFCNSQPLEKFMGQTDSSGEFSYRIKSKLESGEYDVVVNISAEEYIDEYSISRFSVQ